MRMTIQVLLMLGLVVTLACGERVFAAPGFLSVASLAELEEALGQVRGKPALVRVRADWNITDSELDRHFASPCVQKALSDIAWIEWDVTANTDADREFLAKYEVIGPPTFVLFDKSSNHLKGQDVVGYLSAEEIVITLKEVFGLPTNSEFSSCRSVEDAARTLTFSRMS